MRTPDSWIVVGLDCGGTSNNATVLDASGRFLVDRLVEVPSLVQEGPEVAVGALVRAFDQILELTGTTRASVRALGLDTPGPASADGVISSKGATNFSQPAWRGFDFRGALEAKVGLPVVYNNDANAAALYAHHVHIPMHGLLDEGQPLPRCNCGFFGDAESVASLSGIAKNLLPYWVTRFEGHPLAGVEPLAEAAKLVRAYGERGDPLARKIFEQQAMALGRLFTIAANFTDPSAYFLGGGVVEAAPPFREWFLAKVREHTVLREEQTRVATFALVPDRDMAGARGAAIAALETLRTA